MAEPGDPHEPTGDQGDARPDAPGVGQDPDASVGFTSPAAIEGRARLIVEAPADAISVARPEREAEPLPAWAIETPVEQRPQPRRPREFGRRPDPVEGANWAYTVYALILFAVPTVGVSALIGLLAVTGRAAPEGEVARSHFLFQQRTLWAAAIAVLVGVILIIVNLGVFVLFLAAVWTLVRGAFGVLRLKTGRPITNPRTWAL